MIYLLLSLAAAVAASEPPTVDVTLLDGSVQSGAVVRWDREQLVLQGAEGEQTWPTQRLLAMSWQGETPPTDSKATFLELADGALLRIDNFTAKNGVAEVTTARSARLKVRTALIRRVDLQPATAAANDAWQELDAQKPTGDALLVAKRDGNSVDFLVGVLGDVTAEEAHFNWDGEKLDVKRSKVVALSYYHDKAADFPDAVFELEAADGSKIPVRELALDDGRIRVTTPAGIKLTFSLRDLRRADFSAGKLAYLSDLKPAAARWTPQIATPLSAELAAAYGMPRSDQSFAGSALTLLWKGDSLPARRDVRVYAKGLAIRSRTELEYRLPSGMRRFCAIAGIDPVALAQGHVMLEIRGDGRLLWQGAVGGKQPPVELDIDLKGARRLHLKVDYGENLDYGDRLHLVEARVTK